MAYARPAVVVLSAALLAGCAGSGGPRPAGPDLSFFDLQARLAARAASLVGHAGEFRVGAERFAPDCAGFVEAVYEMEGVPLRAMMRQAAPEERSGVAAAFLAMRAYGAVFGGRSEWPSPGDLVFFDDTYDRNRNGRADDRLTHVGIVEYVVDGTVVFVHRGGRAVALGALDPRRPAEASADGRVLNSPLRAKGARAAGVPILAGALFAGYGRIDPARVR